MRILADAFEDHPERPELEERALTTLKKRLVMLLVAAIGASVVACKSDSGGNDEVNLEPGDEDIIAEREGYRAQCAAWNGNVCVEPWIALSEADFIAPDPHCVDDTDTLRPLWYGDVFAQAEVFCWIATGSRAYVSATAGGEEVPVAIGGWMYGEAEEDAGTCPGTGYRRYTVVEIPTVGRQTYSFDQFTELRTGRFGSYECEWE